MKGTDGACNIQWQKTKYSHILLDQNFDLFLEYYERNNYLTIMRILSGPP